MQLKHCATSFNGTMVNSTLLCIILMALGTMIHPTMANVPEISDPNNIYTWPAEDEPHEGTWLQWPHNYGWDNKHIKRYEESWVQIVEALHGGERVHIIAYNGQEKKRIKRLLISRGVDMSQIDLYRYPTDDVWVRDNGPIFVYNKEGQMIVEDWKFNGWVSRMWQE